MDRRSFLIGAGATLIAAPAIVRAASLMPVRNRLATVEVGQWDGVITFIDATNHFLYPDELSDMLRSELLPLSRFKQLTEVACA